jgi:uncharacterized protein (TIGR03085 family)
MSELARAEREALCDLLSQEGPDAPTLCEGWRTRDLAAHLVLRERRPDAAVGLVVRPLAAHTARVQHELSSQPYPVLLGQLRQGPPAWSPTRLAAVDEVANTLEFFVHHEDVRRVRAGAEPRQLDHPSEEVLWSRLRTTARLLLRRSPVGVTLEAPGRQPASVKAGTGTVTVVGRPGELALYLFGRRGVAQVEVKGSPADVAAFEATPLGF